MASPAAPRPRTPTSRPKWRGAATGPLACLLGLALLGCAGAPEHGWEASLETVIEDRSADFAAAAQLLCGFDAVGDDAELHVGDTLLYGVRLDTGTAPRIWYLRVRVAAIHTRRWLEMREVAPFEDRLTTAKIREREAAESAARASGAQPPFDLEDLYQDAPVARLQVEAFDAAGASLGEAESEESLHRLRIGLWSACAAGHARRDLLRRLAEPSADGARIEVGEDEHADVAAVADGIASCRSFFAILRQNPVTQGILYEVIALPSLWSILVHFGVRAGFGIDFADVAQVPAERVPHATGLVWSVPMTIELNDQPALLARLLAAPPLGPAAGAAGVYGFVGRHPTDARRHVHVQLLASRRGAAR